MNRPEHTDTPTVESEGQSKKPKKKQSLRSFFKEYFNLGLDKEDELKTIETISADVDFKGPKMWILMCAIVIASLGLNMNSTAVIIGAMLISPLMGPILGLGLGLGITDFDLVKRSLRNLGMMTLIGIVSATAYFLLTPVETTTSELLARTQPTFYDVLIASFGGLAGIIAGASKNKGNVIPGVAIATALMPPLCTAGYGLATWRLDYFIGAFYLYIINAVFIGLATYITVRLLKYPRVTYIDKAHGRRLTRTVGVIVLCTLLPSIYLAWRMVRTSVKEQEMKTFILNEISDEGRYILSYDTSHHGDSSFMRVNIIGTEISPEEHALLEAKLPTYGLTKTAIVVEQDYGQPYVQELRSSILDDLYAGDGRGGAADIVAFQHYQIDSLQRQLARFDLVNQETQRLAVDMKALFPEVSRLEFGNVFAYDQDSLDTTGLLADTTFQIKIFTPIKKLTEEREETMRRWVGIRMPDAEVVILDNVTAKRNE